MRETNPPPPHLHPSILCYNIHMRVNENIYISSLTTMRLGGVARYVIEVEQPSEIPDAYGFAEMYRLPTFVIGYGANTLGHDEGFPGALIINRMRGIMEEKTESGTVLVKAMGGEYWDDVVKYTCERGLTGIEALSNIPGLAGAAPVQNIGAYGQELSDTLVSVDVYDTVGNTFRTLSYDDLQFDYRRSILNTTAKNRFFVISIILELREGQMRRPFYRSMEDYIAEHNCKDFSPMGVREIVTAIRKDKLPDPMEIPSSGSFFKNVYINDDEAEKAIEHGVPVIRGEGGINKINSAWLIEHAGFAGQVINGIRISKKAPLVLINESATSFNDLARTRDEIVARVYDMFGFWLEQEPVEIG